MNSLTLFMLVYNINKNKYCFHYNVNPGSLKPAGCFLQLRNKHNNDFSSGPCLIAGLEVSDDYD